MNIFELFTAWLVWVLSDLKHSLGLAATLLAIAAIVLASRVGRDDGR